MPWPRAPDAPSRSLAGADSRARPIARGGQRRPVRPWRGPARLAARPRPRPARSHRGAGRAQRAYAQAAAEIRPRRPPGGGWTPWFRTSHRYDPTGMIRIQTASRVLSWPRVRATRGHRPSADRLPTIPHWDSSQTLIILLRPSATVRLRERAGAPPPSPQGTRPSRRPLEIGSAALCVQPEPDSARCAFIRPLYLNPAVGTRLGPARQRFPHQLICHVSFII